ncbi:HK97-gp10 family putative phage morphogenesis protein [Pseudomonas sp.]|uniref:HK97-gp10 family putative phage morphogenesis protein n=1 Tax=Pseudomonas sp. TaxID=306 RepID=UPI003F30013E
MALKVGMGTALQAGNEGGALVRVRGLDDLKNILREIPAELRRKTLLAALRKAARVPLRVARQNVPIMSAESAAKTPYRAAGLLKKRLMVRTSKTARQAGAVGVFINVKPAAGAKYRTQTTRVLGIAFKDRRLVRAGQRGAKSASDPYYWKFVEFGTKKMAAQPFIRPAAEALPEALGVFADEMSVQFKKYNDRK